MYTCTYTGSYFLLLTVSHFITFLYTRFYVSSDICLYCTNLKILDAARKLNGKRLHGSNGVQGDFFLQQAQSKYVRILAETLEVCQGVWLHCLDTS